MATILDITSKLTQEKKALKIGNTEIPVDDSKNTVIAAMAKMDAEGSSVQAMDDALQLLLGKDGFAQAEKLQLSFSDYKTLFLAAIALASGVSMEEMERRFPDKA